MKGYLRSVLKYASSSLVLILLVASIGITGASVFIWSAEAEAQNAGQAILHRDEPLIREAIGVHHRHRESLKRIYDVVGSGVGIGPDGLPVIKVFTTRAGVPGIPKWLESIPVHVEATGMVVAQDCPAGPAGYCNRPVPIGVSTGHPKITAGTIGARVKDAEGNVYALSNNHVYANSNDARIGDSALQPGRFDGGSDTDNYRIGNLYAFQLIDFSIFGSNTIDAAIASTTTEMLGFETLPEPEGYGTPNSAIFGDSDGNGLFDKKDDLLDLPVKKFGRTSGLTHGQISEINVSIAVCYANCSSRLFSKLAWFEDQIGITGKDRVPFSAGGDSGSLIVTDDENNNPVGLLFAGSNTRTFANRIDLVLNSFGVTVDDGKGTLPAPPGAPSSLAATAISSSQINLAWTDNSDNESGFKVERCTGSGCGDFAQIATVGANVKIYSDKGLLASTTYSYRVRAYNAGGDSEYSETATATTQAAPALPAAPTNLTATAASRTQINLSWIDNSNNENGFKIERCTGSSCTNFAQIATVGPNVKTYSNRGLRSGTTYRYRVRAYNAAGNSDYSNIASAKTR